MSRGNLNGFAVSIETIFQSREDQRALRRRLPRRGFRKSLARSFRDLGMSDDANRSSTSVGFGNCQLEQFVQMVVHKRGWVFVAAGHKSNEGVVSMARKEYTRPDRSATRY